MRQDLDIFTKEDEEGTNTQYNGKIFSCRDHPRF